MAENPGPEAAAYTPIVGRKFTPKFWIVFALFLVAIPLIATLLPPLPPHHDKSRYSSLLLNQLEQAIKMYKQDHDEYPPSGSAGLTLLSKPGITARRGHSIYFEFRSSQLDAEKRALDYWRRPIVYRTYRQSFELYSVGPNGIDENGKGDDVTSGE